VPERIEADVCVLGAGYAGLTAARRLSQHGKSVVVLEARDRVGGRIWTAPLVDGTPVDRGGAWLAPFHDAIYALAREVGVTTYKTHVQGAHLLVDGDRIRRYTGLIPKISPVAVLTIARAQWKLDRLAKQVPLDAPWTAPNASALDAESVESYIAHCGITKGIGRDLYEMAIRGLMTGDLRDASFLHLLFLAHAHGSINNLFSIEKGSQENLVNGGAGSIARRIADELGDVVRLNSPVRGVTQRDDRVTVEAGELTVWARFVVSTVPPELALEIAFEPELRDDRVALYRGSIGGPESKTLVVYEEPFWRAAGFSGQTSEPGSASETTIDASPESGTPGVLASFTFGPVAERVQKLDPAARRQAVLTALSARLGRRALEPVDFVETAWAEERWTRGCSMAHLRPGILTRYGHLIREPFGRVHWAGTETSTISHGAIDGAVRSGERAATEILDRG
jgi:monoamine oxidase